MVKDFMELFRGLDRAHGVYYPSRGAMETAKKRADEKVFEAHLKGVTGVGIPMLMDNGKCYFGAIDIDAHGQEKEIDVVALSQKIEELQLPLVACKSKSGGAHLYLFCDPAAQASVMINALRRWAGKLGYGKAEIFPKKIRLEGEGFGHWINLPYFGDTRPAYLNGKPINLNDFIVLSKRRRVSQDVLQKSISEEEGNLDAPPCLLTMIESGISEGHRNEALFNLGIYYRRAFPDNWTEKLMAFNYGRVVPPLPSNEVMTLIKQVNGPKNYNYRCDTEPVASYCAKDACLGRKFGARNQGKEERTLELGELKKVLTQPPRWILTVSGKEVEMSTRELINYDLAREAILERADIVAGPMKKEDWIAVIRGVSASMTTIQAPDDASVGGVVRSRLLEFLSRATGSVDSMDKLVIGKKSDLLRGMPVLLYGRLTSQITGGKEEFAMLDINSDLRGVPYVFFRGPDFVDYLKRRRSEEVKGQMLWSVLRNCGCGHMRMRVGAGQQQVWYRAVELFPMALEEMDNPVDGAGNDF